MRIYSSTFWTALLFGGFAAPAQEDSVRSGWNLLSEPAAKVKGVSSFLEDLQSAVAKDDRRHVADLMSYPLRFGDFTGQMQIQSKKQFVELYPKIFTSGMKRLLAKQRPACVGRVGSQGYSIEEGQLWFDFYPDGLVKIFTINSVIYPFDK